jgi:hypothetical protein
MSIVFDVNARPGEVVTFEEFCSYPDWAVALDGYVNGPSRWDVSHRHVTFDHHENCDRYVARATCEQVALAVQAGMLRSWENGGCQHASAWVNDPDPDVALSVWLLRNPDLVTNRDVAALIRCEGVIDTTGGCVTPGDAEPFERLAWIIDPWMRVRSAGTPSAPDLAGIVDAVGERLDAFAAGRSGRARLDDTFDVVERRGNIAVVDERSPMARCRYADAGISTFVATRPRENGGAADVTVGRVSPWEGPDLAKVWNSLNSAEGVPTESCDRWGGSDMIGGSPRRGGTTLCVGDVLAIIAEHTSP